MSLRQKDTKGIPYWVFSAGASKTIHLGPVDDPSKISSPRTLEALEYVRDKRTHYMQIEESLISFLKTPYGDQYFLTRIRELDSYSDKFSKLMSEAEQIKYLKKRHAELQTRLRQLEEKLLKMSNLDLAQIAAGAAMKVPEDRKAVNKLAEEFRNKLKKDAWA